MSKLVALDTPNPAAMSFRYPTLIIAAVAAFCSTASAQQTADVLKGKVVNDSGKVVVGATVVVTRGPDRATQQVTTDSLGNWTVRFDPGTGDYLVYIAFPGLKAARRRVQSENGERDLTANFTLATDVEMLAAMKTTAVKPVRASNSISPTGAETGAAEKWSDGVSGQLPPTIAGDLTALAATMSGVTMTGAGASILGSGPTSNLTTLNGMGMATGSIPRAARTETRVTGATFDATRGGFAGSNIDVRLGPGSRNYQRRNAFLTFDPPQLQFADPTARQLGAVGGGFRGSFGADGELIRRALTYNVAVDVSRNASDPVTLVNAEADALIRAGASPDSVTRLLALAASPTVNLPLTTGGIPDNRLRQEVAWLGRFDDTRDTLQTRALSTYVGYKKEGALGFGALAAPASAGERRERTLGAQLTHGMFIKNRVLTETRASASMSNVDVDPYRNIPGAVVLLRSDNGGSDAHDVAPISLGGSTIGSDDDSWTGEIGNETIWNAVGRRHRFKAMVWGRADGIRREGSGNALGTFTFNSLDDFAANRASSFSRVLSQPVREGMTWNAATAYSHQYAPTRFFSLLYGARIEANGYGNAPARNAALESALGVTSGAAPMRWHVSPRIGFSYTYNRDRDNGSGTSVNGVGRFYRSIVGVLRGGIGDFRDILRPDMLADASASTGLTGGTSILSCVGTATPVPDWDGYDAGTTPAPMACQGGGGVLAESAPAVTLIDPRFDVPHSWRASLDWTTSVRNWVIKVGALGSYDLDQPGIVDANFAGTPRFSLDDEGSRPVFVSTSAIDANSGAVSAAESRVSSQFGRVTTRVSDLRGYGGQLTFGLSPDAFKFRSKLQLFTSFNYTLQSTKRQFRGFDGAGFGDPREREWAAGPNDARHVVVITGGMSTPKTGTITLFARSQSGLPFTPIVQGDVNGDGRGGDRAFIPMPGGSSAIGDQLDALLANGSETARSCILANQGAVAKRNSCRGPWTNSLNIQWRPPVPRKYVRRLTPNIYLQNVLAGFDQLLHGSDDLRGWGSPATADPVLLVPRSFDAGSRAFTYDVNSRFADTRPGRTVLSNPFRLVIDFSMDLSTDYELQQLRRAVEPVKGPNGWQRRTADSLTSFYLGNTSSIHKLLIAEADSLFLSRAQVAALRRADSVYSAQVRAVYGPLGLYLAAGNGDASKAAVDSASAAHKRYWEIFWKQPEIAAEIVNATQRDLIPMFKSMLAIPMEDRKNSQWQFGYPVQIVDRPGRPIR